MLRLYHFVLSPETTDHSLYITCTQNISYILRDKENSTRDDTIIVVLPLVDGGMYPIHPMTSGSHSPFLSTISVKFISQDTIE